MIVSRVTLRRREHGRVQQGPLEAPASSRGEVRGLVPLLRLAVASGPRTSRRRRRRRHEGSAVLVGTAAMVVAVMLPVAMATTGLIRVAVVAVRSTVDLEDDGDQRDEEANAHAAQKHQGRSLRLVWERNTGPRLSNNT